MPDAIVAVVKNGTAEVIAKYLPSNYEVVDAEHPDGVIIVGIDHAGWTFEGYVQPRLASGLMWAKQIDLGTLAFPEASS